MNATDLWASFPAFGGTAIVQVLEPSQLHAALDAVRDTSTAFDLACSRFREDSELSALNRADGSALRVSPLLLEAVSAAVRAARLTDGDVDPTVGNALIALGYDRDFALVREDSERTSASPARAGSECTGASPARAGSERGSVSFAAVPGWRTIRIDQENGKIALHRGVTLDLGATAKALAADRAAAAAHARSGGGVLVSFGGDVALAGPAPDDGWRIRVTDDHSSGVDAPGQWITLVAGGLATSSTSVRRWNAGDATVHHLLDPSSGQPAPAVWRTVSVAAATCLDANIATTAAIVRGQSAVAWLQSLRLPSRLVSEQGTSLHLADWPAHGDDLPCYQETSEALA